MPTDGPSASLKVVSTAFRARAGKATARQLRLLAVAFARRVQHLVPSPALHKLVDRGERAADRKGARLASLNQKDVQDLIDQGHDYGGLVLPAAYVCQWAAAPSLDVQGVSICLTTAWWAEWKARLAEDDCLPPRGRRARRQRFTSHWLALLDDLLPGPAPSVTPNPSWHTPLIASLLGSIIEERDYALTPILADALEDAGCSCPVLLEHLRWHPVHVHGCWALEGLQALGLALTGPTTARRARNRARSSGLD
jgi:hypothetical protein